MLAMSRSPSLAPAALRPSRGETFESEIEIVRVGSAQLKAGGRSSPPACRTAMWMSTCSGSASRTLTIRFCGRCPSSLTTGLRRCRRGHPMCPVGKRAEDAGRTTRVVVEGQAGHGRDSDSPGFDGMRASLAVGPAKLPLRRYPYGPPGIDGWSRASQPHVSELAASRGRDGDASHGGCPGARDTPEGPRRGGHVENQGVH